MLDQLIQLVEQNAGKAIVQNNAIPNQHNGAAIQEVASQIFSSLQSQVSQGNMQQVVAMFQGNNSSLSGHPMIAQLVANVASSLSSKFGVSPSAAQTIASGLLPKVMNQFVQKTNDPNDSSFDLTSMMQTMSGNSNLDLSGILGQLTGGKSNQSLGGMLGDLLGKF